MKLKYAILGSGWVLLVCLAAVAVAAMVNPNIADRLLWRFESLERSPSVTQRSFESRMERYNLYREQYLPLGTPLIFGDSHLQLIPTETIHWAANFALGGQPIRRMIDRVPNFKSVETASIIFINGGENDLIAGDSVGQIEGYWQTLLQRLPKAKKVVCVGLPEADPPRINAQRVKQLNVLIAEVCTKNGNQFLPIRIGDGVFKDEQMASDNLHLSRDALQRLATLMQQMAN
jgi:hypothetical protein